MEEKAATGMNEILSHHVSLGSLEHLWIYSSIIGSVFHNCYGLTKDKLRQGQDLQLTYPHDIE